MNTQRKLAAEVSKWDWMRPHLEAEEFDSVAMLSALESETEVTECLLELAESALEDKRMAELVAQRIAELQERKKAIERRMDRKRTVIGVTLRHIGMTDTPIRGPNMTLSYREGGREVVIMDEAKVLEKYKRIIPEDEKIDMPAVRAALEAKIPVEGACLSNDVSPNCAIRVR